MNRQCFTCLVVLQLIFLVIAFGLCSAEQIHGSSFAADERGQESEFTTAAQAHKVTTTTIRWNVISSGGTQATIGSDKVLYGTAIQTAIGEVTSPNYIVRQGFWQSFAPACLQGDADGNGYLSISDAVFIVNFIFGGGAPPERTCNGDVNGDGFISISDAVEVISFVFKG